MERSRTEYSLINIFTGFVGYGLNSLLGFICRIVFVRCLAADYLGISGLFTNILTMLSVAELGISSVICYALYKPIADDDKGRIAALMNFYKRAYQIIGVIVAVIGLLIIPLLPVIINNPPAIEESLLVIYLLYLFNTVVSYFFSYRSIIYTAMQRNYIVIGYNYLVTVLQSIFQMGFLLMTHNYMIYLIIQIIGGISYNVYLYYKAGKEYPYIKESHNVATFTSKETKTLFRDIKALAIYKITGVLVNNTDNIIISYFKGVISVGLTSNYILLSTTLNTLVQQVFTSLTGSVGNLNATADDQKKYDFFNSLNLANFWLYSWCAIGIAFVSSDLVNLLFGKDYVMSISIPIILAINFYMLGMQQAVYIYKSTLGLFRYGQYILIFTAAINLALDILLGRFLGVFGIFLATALARLLTNTWYEPYAVYKYGLKVSPIEYFYRYMKFLCVLLIEAAICFLTFKLFNFSLVLNVILKMITCTAVSQIVFIVVFRKTKEYDYLINKIKFIFMKVITKIKH